VGPATILGDPKVQASIVVISTLVVLTSCQPLSVVSPNAGQQDPSQEPNIQTPAAPTNVVATADAQSLASLVSWLHPLPTEHYFELEIDGQSAVTTTDGQTQVLVQASPGQHTVRVRAIRIADSIRSAFSGLAPLTVLTPHSSPSNLTVTALANGQARLNWTNSNSGHTGFQIERTTLSSNAVSTLSASSTATQLNDNPGYGNFSYRIKAVNSAAPIQNSAFSLAVSVSLLAPPASNDANWTTLVPTDTARLIYIGDTNCTGAPAFYSKAQAGSDPTQPTITVQACGNTSSLRANSSDWLIYRKGKSYAAPALVSGASATAPIVITSFGSGSRPVFTNRLSQGSGSLNNISIVDLEMPSINLLGQGSNILIEGVRLNGPSIIQGYPLGARYTNVTVRRSQIVGANGGSHTQGFYFQDVDNLVFSENLVSDSGWDMAENINADQNAVVAGNQHALVFAQGLYVHQGCGPATVVDNLFARNGGSIQVRSGGTVARNFSFDHAVGLQFGHNETGIEYSYDNSRGPYKATGTFKYNVVSKGHYIWTKDDNGPWYQSPRGHALWIANAENVIAEGNVATHLGLSGGTVANAGIMYQLENSKNITLRNSVAYDWYNASDNIVEPGTTTTNLTQTGILDYSRPQFGTGGNFSDPGRSLDSYAQSLNYTNGDSLLMAARENRKGFWNPALTGNAVATHILAGFGITPR
jgi:hypothetical protein